MFVENKKGTNTKHFLEKGNKTMEESRTFLDKQDATEVIKKCYEEGKISREDCKVLLDRLNLCPTLTIRGTGKTPEAPYIFVTDVCGLLSDIEYKLQSCRGFSVDSIAEDFFMFISTCKSAVLKAADTQRPDYKEFSAVDADLLLLKIQNEIEQRTRHCLDGKTVRLHVSNIIECHKKQLRKDMGEQERAVVLDTAKEKLEFALGLLQQVKEDIDK